MAAIRQVNEVRRALCAALLGGGRLAHGAEIVRSSAVPILVYHRFAPAAVDSMTVRQARFEAHLELLQRLECTIVPLANVVDWRSGRRGALPERAVALCADDGHRSQFERMAPAVRERGWPMTLFVYPSAISNASYAMTWLQLRSLAADARIDVQSHTYWHPNFARDRQRLAPQAFAAEVSMQLRRSKAVLEQRLDTTVSLLAWPFGIVDDTLAEQAAEAGYEAGFVLGNRAATSQDPPFALPRYLMVDSVDERQLAVRLHSAFGAAAAR